MALHEDWCAENDLETKIGLALRFAVLTMRSSRQTELEQHHPTYKICTWLGNTPQVAHKHYLTVTDDDDTDAAADSRGTQTPVGLRTNSHKKSRTVHSVRKRKKEKDRHHSWSCLSATTRPIHAKSPQSPLCLNSPVDG